MNERMMAREQWTASCTCGEGETGERNEMHEWADNHIDTHDTADPNSVSHRVTVKQQAANAEN